MITSIQHFCEDGVKNLTDIFSIQKIEKNCKTSDFILNFIQKNFIKINLNKDDYNEGGGGFYVYRQRKITGILKGIL